MHQIIHDNLTSFKAVHLHSTWQKYMSWLVQLAALQDPLSGQPIPKHDDAQDKVASSTGSKVDPFKFQFV